MTYGKGLPAFAALTAATLTAALALVFFFAPLDADQGFVQKIFYLHVPMGIVALAGFVAGGAFAVQHLRTRDPRHDLRSYVAIHLSLILAVGVLVTGSIWAKASWGAWWVWDEPMLVVFLIIFLLYACYQPLRFSIEDRDRQARSASVFAITAGAFTPLCFGAVRFAQEAYIHPRTFDSTGVGMPAEMFATFVVAFVGMTLLFVTLWKYEMAAKHTTFRLRALRRALAGDDDLAPVRRSAAPQSL